jgi:3-hydroxybutyryl-CoA dehydrogenase
MSSTFHTISVIGAGAMGRGIAQMAAQAGSQVLLFDTQPDAVQQAIAAVGQQWDKLAAKGRLDPAQLAAYRARLRGLMALRPGAV